MTEEAKTMLKEIQGPIAVISVAGNYREGKSTIINRMLLRIKKGFKVGNEVEACTKGIMIWSKPIKHELKGETINILVTDTEGLGSNTSSERHDLAIFCLSLLTSSHFIYNSMRVINKNALNQLSLVVKIAEQLKCGASAGPQDFEEFMPKFIWLVRDFSLGLSRQGQQITEN